MIARCLSTTRSLGSLTSISYLWKTGLDMLSIYQRKGTNCLGITQVGSELEVFSTVEG
jgi:hypothetical protein